MKRILLCTAAALLFAGSAQAASLAITNDTDHSDRPVVVTPAPDSTTPVDPDTTNSTTVVKKHVHPNGDTKTVIKKKHHDDDNGGAVIIHKDDPDNDD